MPSCLLCSLSFCVCLPMLSTGEIFHVCMHGTFVYEWMFYSHLSGSCMLQWRDGGTQTYTYMIQHSLNKSTLFSLTPSTFLLSAFIYPRARTFSRSFPLSHTHRTSHRHYHKHTHSLEGTHTWNQPNSSALVRHFASITRHLCFMLLSALKLACHVLKTRLPAKLLRRWSIFLHLLPSAFSVLAFVHHWCNICLDNFPLLRGVACSR